MAKIELKTTIGYADLLMTGQRMFDIREKHRGIKADDVIRFVPWYNGREVKQHPITGRRYRVTFVDHTDPRVMKDYDIFSLEEIVPQWK